MVDKDSNSNLNDSPGVPPDVMADAEDAAEYLAELGEEAAEIARRHNLGAIGALFAAAADAARRYEAE